MQLNKIMKGVFIALPVVTLMACSSNNANDQASQAATNQPVEETTATSSTGSTVEMGTVEKEKSPQEIMQEKKAELIGNQTILFDFDRSSVDSKFYPMLNEHARFLVQNPGESVVIEGHCDKRGTPEYNIALGERRAKALETFLQNAGVSRSQIKVVSYGEEKPVAMGDTESAFSQNRRAVLVYQ